MMRASRHCSVAVVAWVLLRFFFFFSSRRRHTRLQGDWSSDRVLFRSRLTDEVHDAREVRGAEDPVHFGHLPEDLAAVALREAAGDDEASAAPPLLQSRQLQDRRDRLLTGAVDEGARVDDEALGILGPVGEREPRLAERAEHQLGVDLVLGTTEGREMDLHDRHFSITGRLTPARRATPSPP